MTPIPGMRVYSRETSCPKRNVQAAPPPQSATIGWILVQVIFHLDWEPRGSHVMMRATIALVRRRRERGASVRFLRQVDYVGSAPRNTCFANALKVCNDSIGPDGPRYTVSLGWIVLRYSDETAVLQHAWNIDVTTGRHFDVTELADGNNSGAQYVEDPELRIALNATFELTPVFVGRSFLFRDNNFYEIASNQGSGATRPFEELAWTDFSTPALLRR